jgi:hypothetical protein
VVNETYSGEIAVTGLSNGHSYWFYPYINDNGTNALQAGTPISTNNPYLLQTAANAANSTSVTVTLPADSVVGNTLIVTIGVGTTNVQPSIVSVIDTVSSVYTQMGTASNYYSGGGNNYYSTMWLYSAPVTNVGPIVVTATVSNYTGPLEITITEMVGIYAAADGPAADNYIVNGTSFSTGSISVQNIDIIWTAVLNYSTGTGLPSEIDGYISSGDTTGVGGTGG